MGKSKKYQGPDQPITVVFPKDDGTFSEPRTIYPGDSDYESFKLTQSLIETQLREMQEQSRVLRNNEIKKQILELFNEILFSNSKQVKAFVRDYILRNSLRWDLGTWPSIAEDCLAEYEEANYVEIKAKASYGKKLKNGINDIFS